MTGMECLGICGLLMLALYLIDGRKRDKGNDDDAF
jgi:hypothetical protein